MQGLLCLEERIAGLFIEDRKRSYYDILESKNYYKRSKTRQWNDFFAMYQSHCSKEDTYVVEAGLIVSGRAKNDAGKRIWLWKDRLIALKAWEKEKKIVSNQQVIDLKRIETLLNSTYLKVKQPDIFNEVKTILGKQHPPWNGLQTIKKTLQYFALGVSTLAVLAVLYNQPLQKQSTVNYVQKEQAVHTPKPHAIVYSVKKGDTLWNIVQRYFEKQSVHQLYTKVDEIALYNGLGTQRMYTIGDFSKKNPHYLVPGQLIRLPLP